MKKLSTNTLKHLKKNKVSDNELWFVRLIISKAGGKRGK
jgi:hypothetical protein